MEMNKLDYAIFSDISRLCCFDDMYKVTRYLPNGRITFTKDGNTIKAAIRMNGKVKRLQSKNTIVLTQKICEVVKGEQ